MYKLDLEMAEESDSQISNICWVIEKAREFQENIFCFIDYAKPLAMWITTNCGKLLETEISDHFTCLLRNLYAGQEANQNWTWNNRLVQNWERSTSRLYIDSKI